MILKEGDKIELGGMAAFWVFAPSSMTLDILTVTIMFTDIVESTALTDRLGDSLARSVLRTHDAFVRRQMNSHNSTEVKALGDGFMITSPVPRAARTTRWQFNASWRISMRPIRLSRLE